MLKSRHGRTCPIRWHYSGHCIRYIPRGYPRTIESVRPIWSRSDPRISVNQIVGWVRIRARVVPSQYGCYYYPFDPVVLRVCVGRPAVSLHNNAGTSRVVHLYRLKVRLECNFICYEKKQILDAFQFWAYPLWIRF